MHSQCHILLESEKLKELLTYNSSTGYFYWNESRGGVIRGSQAGHVHKNGYVYIRIYGKAFRAHRLAWLYMTGEMPKNILDHANGIPSDNRFKNLREATYTENMLNRKIQKSNNSGYIGVSFCKRHNKWRARLKINGKEKYIGEFFVGNR